MRAGDRTQAIGDLDRARDTRAESNAVVRTGNIIIHRLRNGYDFRAFLE